jgi:hypothetical protein
LSALIRSSVRQMSNRWPPESGSQWNHTEAHSRPVNSTPEKDTPKSSAISSSGPAHW